MARQPNDDESKLRMLRAADAELRRQLARRSARVAELEGIEAGLRRQLGTRTARVEVLEATETELRKQVEQQSQQIQKLEEAEGDLQWQVQAHLARIDDLEQGEAKLKAEVERQRVRIAQLEGENDEARKRLEARANAALAFQANQGEWSQQLREANARIQTLEACLADAEAARDAARREALERTPAKDDLKRLRGIGPAYERSLHLLGIDTFEQIAQWTPEQVTEIADKLRIKPQRILRDDWIGSAKALAARG